MPERFQYDVFLSHSSQDKAVVRPIAERLRQDGLKVWLDEWVLKAGDSIPAKIEEGLEHSRVLVLCMSAHTFGSDWVQLEAGTFRFRDALNKERRFIPLRLDDSPIKGSLAQFLYINWFPTNREQEYSKLLEGCKLATKLPKPPEKHAASNQISEKPEFRAEREAKQFLKDTPLGELGQSLFRGIQIFRGTRSVLKVIRDSGDQRYESSVIEFTRLHLAAAGQGGKYDENLMDSSMAALGRVGSSQSESLITHALQKNLVKGNTLKAAANALKLLRNRLGIPTTVQAKAAQSGF